MCKNNFYILTYREVILAHAWVNMNFMQLQQPVCGLSNRHCAPALISKEKGILTGKKELWLSVSLSLARLFVTPWTAACQAPLSMGILQSRILEWVAMPFSRGSSWPRDRTWVSCIAGGLFPVWATREEGPQKMPWLEFQFLVNWGSDAWEAAK